MSSYYPNRWLILFLLMNCSLFMQTTNAAESSQHTTDMSEQFRLETVAINHHKVTRYHVVDGVIEAVRQATLTAQTSGQVLDVNFDVEDFVKKGVVLMRFKDNEQRAALAQARAQLSEAQARLKAARDEHLRVKKSYEKRAVSASYMDQMRADLDAAKARVSAGQAAVRQTQQQFDYTVVKAPYSGYVIERHIEPGEVANIGQPIMTGLSLNELRAVANVPQSYLHLIRNNRKAVVRVGSGMDQHAFDGKDIRISPHADINSHTFQVRVNLPEETSEVLFPGTFAKIAFVIGEVEQLMVPRQALALRGEVRAVYVQKADGTIFMRQVRTGSLHDDMIAVLAGLEAGEQVITNPVDAAVALKAQRAQVAEVAHHD